MLFEASSDIGLTRQFDGSEDAHVLDDVKMVTLTWFEVLFGHFSGSNVLWLTRLSYLLVIVDVFHQLNGIEHTSS
jgi:hypothetical protein